MSCQMVFQRYEIKYQLSRSQASSLLKFMKPYMTSDIYGHTTIRNIYFDTDTYRLIRHSIERPAYKEKLRLRSYAPAKPEDPVFVELKKKYQSVVYKRRLRLPQNVAMDCILHHKPLLEPDTVLLEIKTSGGLPLWLTHWLTRYHLYKTSFSKYGTAYQKIIYPQSPGGILHA